MTFAEEIAEARKRVDDFDEIDGWKDREITTVHSALQAGLINPGTGAHYDAFVMLTDIINNNMGVET